MIYTFVFGTFGFASSYLYCKMMNVNIKNKRTTFFNLPSTGNIFIGVTTIFCVGMGFGIDMYKIFTK